MLTAIAGTGIRRGLQRRRVPGRLRVRFRPAPNVQDLVDWLLRMDWLESTGLLSGLLCVVLLIRQNIWNWPIGLLYSLVSVVVFYRSKLYADLALHVPVAQGRQRSGFGGTVAFTEPHVVEKPERFVLGLSQQRS